MQTKLCVVELFSQLSSALTTDTHESLNWKLLYGITGYMYFLLPGCANKLLYMSVCVHMCVYFWFLGKAHLHKLLLRLHSDNSCDHPIFCWDTNAVNSQDQYSQHHPAIFLQYLGQILPPLRF